MKTAVIYEDDAIIIVYKPAGLATQTARVGQADVVSELKNYLALQSPYLGVVHRLDQPVEGLLVFAKTRQAAAALTKQLGEGNLHKQYYGVICGKPAAEAGTLTDYLYKDANNKAQILKEKDAHFDEARKAVLHYRLVRTERKACEDNSKYSAADFNPAYIVQELSLLDIQIETGRFHQIRAQLAHAGMPLLGDAKYADEDVQRLSKELGIRTVALCASRIRLIHPVTKKEMEFQVRPQGKAFCQFFEERKYN